MKKIVFDIETKNSFAEVGKREATALDISLLVVYDYETDKYTSYLQEDFLELWKVLEKTDLIIGFNSNWFDVPLLNKYYPGDLTKIQSLDILEKFRESAGLRIGLDAIAEATLGIGKTAGGLEAVAWWKEGKIDKIREYCIGDVKVTKGIYDFARKNGYLNYKNYAGELQRVDLDTSDWEAVEKAAPINYTLPI
jgi:DEAD/DEAH box helicase domain-containing protein